MGCNCPAAGVRPNGNGTNHRKERRRDFQVRNSGAALGRLDQDSTGSQAYQQNFYLRRLRIIVGGDIGKDISFFVETDDPKLGIQPKNLAAGFLLQDALLEWRPTTVFHWSAAR